VGRVATVPSRSDGMSEYVVKFSKFCCQDMVYFYENMIGWYLVCEDDGYSSY
jgi:hypothetical protein